MMQLCWVSSNRRVAVVFAVPRLVLFMVRSFFPLVGVPALMGTAGRSCCDDSVRPRRILPLLLTFTIIFSWASHYCRAWTCLGLLCSSCASCAVPCFLTVCFCRCKYCVGFKVCLLTSTPAWFSSQELYRMLSSRLVLSRNGKACFSGCCWCDSLTWPTV